MVTTTNWSKFLIGEFRQYYFKQILRTLEVDKEKYLVCPKQEDVFKAFNLSDFQTIKVVILGQDPYHTPGVATGLAFATPNDFYPKPPSLQRIMKMAKINEYDSSLEGWAQQGVFLLNTILTVRQSEPMSHADIGWQKFTRYIVEDLGLSRRPTVFLLWGKEAQKFRPLINENIHCVLEAPHPSPLAGDGFLECDHFNKANEFLEKTGQTKIRWEQTSAF